MPTPLASDRSNRKTLAVALFLAVGAFWYKLHQSYPLQHWLIWRTLVCWVGVITFLSACLSVGWIIVDRLGARLRWSERLVVAVPIGVLAFTLAMFVLGLAGFLGPASFFILPVCFVVIGVTSARRDLHLLWAHRRTGLRSGHWGPLSWLPLAALSLGLVGLLLTYVPILTPDNIQHDARWYHLPIAQQYASSGTIGRFNEVWLLATYPHLASILYSWALSAPASIIDRLLFCAHLEYILFLYTLASLPIMVRAIVRRWIPGSWAAFFLFPGIFVYDSNLATGADHIAAIWAPSAFLLAVRLRDDVTTPTAALLGTVAAGAALTKYSAACLFIPAMCALVWLSLTRPSGVHTKRFSRTGWLAVAAGVTMFVLVSAQHWLKNWIWYGDPLYPMLRQILPSSEWHADVENYFRQFQRDALLRPAAGLNGVWSTIWAVVTLGYTVNEFDVNGDYPSFGYLFPIATLISWFLGPRRLLLAVALCIAGAAVWFVTNHRDRYLQAILPWLAVVTFCSLHTLWQSRNMLLRAAATAAVGSQLVASIDIWLLPTHLMTSGAHPLLPLVEFVKQGYEGKYSERSQPSETWAFSDWAAIGSKLPKASKVLVHEDRLWIGLDAPVMVDEPAWQTALHYGRLGNVFSIDRVLRRNGITHVVLGRPHSDGGQQSLSGELLFWDYLLHNTCPVFSSGHLSVRKLRKVQLESDMDAPPRRALILSCKTEPVAGLYELGSLASSTNPSGPPVRTVDIKNIAPGEWTAEYLIIEKGCGDWRRHLRDFKRLHSRGDLTFWQASKIAGTGDPCGDD